MQANERMAIEWECSRLVMRYCILVDSYAHEELVGLWAQEALWETWKGPLRTHAEMRAYLDAKPRDAITIHMAHNVLIDAASPDEATGISAFTYHGTRSDDPAAVTPRVVGRWYDRFVHTSAGWRFAHRRTEMTFQAG